MGFKAFAEESGLKVEEIADYFAENGAESENVLLEFSLTKQQYAVEKLKCKKDIAQYLKDNGL